MNKSAKDFLRRKFEQWYAQNRVEIYKFPMNMMKPLGAEWLMELHSYMLNHPDIIYAMHSGQQEFWLQNKHLYTIVATCIIISCMSMYVIE